MFNKLLGFTLVELMVTIAVAAILLTIGVPSLLSIYEQSRADNNIRKIHDAFAFARNQAVSYGITVNVCPYETATSCGSTTDWSKGMRVYIDGGTDKELRVIDGFNSNDLIKGTVTSATFSSDGLSSGATIIYCAGGKSAGSRSVNVSTSGLVKFGDNDVSCS